MTRSARMIVLVLITSVGPGLGAVALAKAATQTVTGIQRAAWLQGCWEMTTATRSVEEAWTPPKAGAMIGRRVEFPYRRTRCTGQ